MCSNRISLCYWVWLYRRIFVQAFCRRHLRLKSVPKFCLVHILLLLSFRNFYFISSYTSGSLITLMEFFPPISLYRIIYELSPPPSMGPFSDFSGVHLGDLSDPENGILVLLIIMVLEWPIFLFLTLYLDEFGCLRNGIRKLLTASRPNGSYQTPQKPSTQTQEFEASIEIDRTDILREVHPKYFYLYICHVLLAIGLRKGIADTVKC